MGAAIRLNASAIQAHSKAAAPGADSNSESCEPLHVIIASFHLSGGRDDDLKVAENVACRNPERVESVRRMQLDALAKLMREQQNRLQLDSAILLFGGDANSFVPDQAEVCQIGYAKGMLEEAFVRLQAGNKEDDDPCGNNKRRLTRLAKDFARVQQATCQFALILPPSDPENLAELIPLCRVSSEQEKIYKSIGDNELVPLECSSTINGGQVDHFYCSMKTGPLRLQDERVEILADKWWSLQPGRPGQRRFQKGTSDHNAIMFRAEVVAHK